MTIAEDLTIIKRRLASIEEKVAQPNEPNWEPEAVYQKRYNCLAYHIRKLQYWLDQGQTGYIGHDAIRELRKMGLATRDKL